MGPRVLALACLVLASCGGGGEEKQGSLTGASATTDRPDRVRLAWTVEGDSPDLLYVERDGERIATLRGSARSFEDRMAATGTFSAPKLEAKAGSDAVHLRWGSVEALPGPDHVYTVVAVADGDETSRVTATGSRGPQVLEGWSILRDGEAVVTVPAIRRDHDDEDAGEGQLGEPQGVVVAERPGGLEVRWEPGSSVPGPAHEYGIVAFGPHGARVASAPVAASRSAPAADAFEILRDGTLVERLPPSARSFVDRGAHPGRAIAGSVVAMSGPDTVSVGWSPLAEAGTEHAYRVRAVAGDGGGPASRAVSGRRSKPAVQGWRITRDGVEVAAMPAVAQSWEDLGAAPPWIDAPVALSATRGTRADGVLLAWESGSSVVYHRYEVVAVTEEGDGDPSWALGGRALPELGYEVRRGGGQWVPVGDVRSWLDTNAPAAVVRPMQARAIVDRHRGFADLTLASPFSVEPVEPIVYTVRTSVAGLPTALTSSVDGFRGLDADFQWKRRDGARRTPIPGATSENDFDPEPPLNSSIAWVLEVSSGGVPIAESAQSLPVTISGYSSVSVSWGFACGVRSFDGRAVCWGTSQSSPPFMPKLPDTDFFSSVSAGRSHVCGLRLDGTIACRGGDVDANTEPSPAFEYESLSSGYEHACAVRVDDRKAICWGRNDLGRASPPADVEFLAVTAGFDHSCGLRMDGKAVCWGSYGAAPPDVKFSSIAAGRSFTCGVTAAGGGLRCWGSEEVGLVGEAPPTGSFVSVTAGKEHACALRAGDRIPVCWGRDLAGETVPDPSVVGALQISAGELATCAILPDERVRCWGAVSPPPSREAYSQVSAGVEHTCGIRRGDGRLRCWGYDPDARLPRMFTAEAFEAVSSGAASACAIRAADHGLSCWGGASANELDPPVDPEGYSGVAVGDGFACALRRADGKAICWGPRRPPSAPITPSDEAYLELAAGRTFVCGLLAFDRTIECWLGDGGFTDRLVYPGTFERVSASSTGGALCSLASGSWTASCWNVNGGLPGFSFFDSFDQVAIGANHACGIARGGGTLVCAGSAGKGQAGTPAIRAMSFTDVTAGKEFTCGVRQRDGYLLCWGDNWYGQAPSRAADP